MSIPWAVSLGRHSWAQANSFSPEPGLNPLGFITDITSL